MTEEVPINNIVVRDMARRLYAAMYGYEPTPDWPESMTSVAAIFDESVRIVKMNRDIRLVRRATEAMNEAQEAYNRLKIMCGTSMATDTDEEASCPKHGIERRRCGCPG